MDPDRLGLQGASLAWKSLLFGIREAAEPRHSAGYDGPCGSIAHGINGLVGWTVLHGDLGSVPQEYLGLVAEGRELSRDPDHLAIQGRQVLECDPVPAAHIAGKGRVFALAIEIDIDLAGAHEGKPGAAGYADSLSDVADRILAGN